MLCKKCRDKFGPIEKYLIIAIEQWDTKEDKGLQIVKNKLIEVLSGERSEIYNLQEQVIELNERLNTLEDINEL